MDADLNDSSSKNYIFEFLKFMLKSPPNSEKVDNIEDSKWFQQNESKFYKNCDKVSEDMMNLLTNMPLVSEIEGILPVVNLVRSVSYSCVGCIVCYKGMKMLFSPNENEKIEGKEMLGRIAYSFVFGTFSIKMIDTMITFNNLLIKLLTSKFTLLPMMSKLNKSYGILLPIVLTLAELFGCLKIMVGFWMRMAELVFNGTISPAIYVLWINKDWSGYLKAWWRRITILVFTQLCQVLMLIIYTMLVNGLLMTGTLSGVCLTIATLLTIDSTPKILQGFMDTSGIQVAKRTARKVSGTASKVKKGFRKYITKV